MPPEVKTMTEDIIAKAALTAVAAQHGVTVDEVVQSIQEALAAAWGDPAASSVREQIFPDGMPSVDAAVIALAKITDIGNS